MNRPIKLHLGCGRKKIHNFINIDINPDVCPDMVYDISKINECWGNEVDLIYSCHVLEHFPRKPFRLAQKPYMDVLSNWHIALKSGGLLRLSVPDFRASVEYYLQNGKIDHIMSYLYGGQKNDFDFHYMCWDFETLKSDLIQAGFKDICRYDWRKTEHSFIDDYSQAYLPHMDKVNGKLMSLNVEATKI